jgi:hypothetical protein
MKHLLLSAALLITAPSTALFHIQNTPMSAQANSAPSPSPEQTEESQRKEMKRQYEEMRKRSKAEEKERLGRPAQIQISAPVDRVGALLVRRMNEQGYQLADEGKYRLVFQREVKGFKAGMATAMSGGDSPPLWTASFTLTELSGRTTVSVDMAVIIRRRFGTPSRTDMNKHKESRRDLDALLNSIKNEAESR